jgi:phosphoglycolate phosphatase-like HAD superfamily hydrolase
VLASSAKDEELSALRSVIDADDVIDAATSSSDAESGKPDPDIVLAALGEAELEPENAVFVGDAIWDAYAAQRAKLTFIGLTCGGTPDLELRRAGAVEVWRDPADLLAHLEQSAIAAL